MKPKENLSPLASAVDSLEHTLKELDRFANEAAAKPLNSEKHMQQTATALRQLGELEGALQTNMQRLNEALGMLGMQQQRILDTASARAAELQARHAVFAAWMDRYASLGEQATELQKHLTAVVDGAADADVSAVIDKVAALVIEAEALEAKAVEDDFVDLVKHARSLRQQLAAAHTGLLRRVEKLQQQASSTSTTTPGGG